MAVSHTQAELAEGEEIRNLEHKLKNVVAGQKTELKNELEETRVRFKFNESQRVQDFTAKEEELKAIKIELNKAIKYKLLEEKSIKSSNNFLSTFVNFTNEIFAEAVEKITLETVKALMPILILQPRETESNFFSIFKNKKKPNQDKKKEQLTESLTSNNNINNNNNNNSNNNVDNSNNNNNNNSNDNNTNKKKSSNSKIYLSFQK